MSGADFLAGKQVARRTTDRRMAATTAGEFGGSYVVRSRIEPGGS